MKLKEEARDHGGCTAIEKKYTKMFLRDIMQVSYFKDPYS
jgi:hypothetical protein